MSVGVGSGCQPSGRLHRWRPVGEDRRSFRRLRHFQAVAAAVQRSRTGSRRGGLTDGRRAWSAGAAADWGVRGGADEAAAFGGDGGSATTGGIADLEETAAGQAAASVGVGSGWQPSSRLRRWRPVGEDRRSFRRLRHFQAVAVAVQRPRTSSRRGGLKNGRRAWSAGAAADWGVRGGADEAAAFGGVGGSATTGGIAAARRRKCRPAAAPTG